MSEFLILVTCSFCWVALSSLDVRTFFLLYLVMSGCFLLEACSFVMKDRKRDDLNRWECGEGLGRTEKRERVIKIHCTSAESILNKLKSSKTIKIEFLRKFEPVSIGQMSWIWLQYVPSCSRMECW